MGKKNRKKDKQKKKKHLKPFVSVCTPTFNRRPFIEHAIKCFEHQDYPKHRMEWIIIDDGTDKIEDLVKDIPEVKYFKYDEKMSLGKKRNLMHDKSCGEIIVYMDDDDYYPPQRVSHAVDMLQRHKNALCAGSSEIHIYFKHIEKLYQFGPYGPKHSTAGTFAFKRELLKDHRYDDHAALAEEKAFLKNYTVPFVQLDTKKTILVFSHIHNTFDKKKLLDNPHPTYVKESKLMIDDFIKEPEMKDFYMNQIDKLLPDYDPGKPDMKPDVLKQMKEIEAKRKKMMEDHAKNQKTQQVQKIVLNQPDGTSKVLSNEDIVNMLKQQQVHLQNLTKAVKDRDDAIQQLKNILAARDKQLKELHDENNDLKEKIKLMSTLNENKKNFEVDPSLSNVIQQSNDIEKIMVPNKDYKITIPIEAEEYEKEESSKVIQEKMKKKGTVKKNHVELNIKELMEVAR